MEYIDQLSGPHILNEIQSYWKETHKKLLELSLEDRQRQYLALYVDFMFRFRNKISDVVKLLEKTAESLIGTKLITPGNEAFTISMVEIYADGIWDESGDYIKEMFEYSMTTAEKKMHEGPMLYYHFGRLDIKAFGEYLPFSFLIRNLIKPDGTLLTNNKNGAAYPKEKYEKIFGVPKDILIDDKNSNQLLLDGSHGFKLEGPSEKILTIPSRRILNGKHTGLAGLYKHCQWNLSIQK